MARNKPIIKLVVMAAVIAIKAVVHFVLVFLLSVCPIECR